MLGSTFHTECCSHAPARGMMRPLFSRRSASEVELNVTSVVTLYDDNGDGMFDFDEFIKLVSDLLCLKNGVLFAPPQAGRNLAEVLAKQIPGPARDTIEVAHLVELDGRWASLITQPDVVAAGGAGLRSLSDQGLRRDLEDLRARRQAELVSVAGFGTTHRQLSRFEYGCRLPNREHVYQGPQGVRQRVLLECLERLEEASPTARYHKLAQHNLRRWSQVAARARAGLPPTPPPTLNGACTVRVLPRDWGQVTLEMTRQYGVIFASLNMANAYTCGGGYTHGAVAQEENMFRRTDCHFSLERNHMDGYRADGRSLYSAEMTLLISGGEGRVYLDKARPRVCIRGPEDSSRADLGYPWLADDEVFPFYELRAAAVDLRGKQAFDADEAARRVAAQLDTLIEHGVRHAVLSAFGCGAFLNPADQVARIYRQELLKRATQFDVIAFAIFHAGYGPDNFKPFAKEFDGWPWADEGSGRPAAAAVHAPAAERRVLPSSQSCSRRGPL